MGGTSLSIQRGHRQSIDIDLFTDAEYDTIDFKAIDSFLRKNYQYVDTNNTSDEKIGWGVSYFVGESEDDSIKLDLYYTDPFIRAYEEIDGIRLATVEEIIAMKMDVISRGGRKKDFWDIHEIYEEFSLETMLALHEERYPYGHEKEKILKNFLFFEQADEDFDPICLRGKHWELIKLDLTEYAAKNG